MVSAEWEQPHCCLLGGGSSAMLRSWVQEEGGGGCRGLWLHPSHLPLLSAQMAGLLCEEEVLEVDNVKYCGYCKYHFSKMVSPARLPAPPPPAPPASSSPGWEMLPTPCLSV